MRIYRIEDERHYGPYRYCDTYEKTKLQIELCHCHNDPKYYPTPCEDFTEEDYDKFDNDDYRCGFDSIASTADWFVGFFYYLAKAEYKLAIYDIPDDLVLKGKRQVAFLYNTKPIRSFSITAIFCNKTGYLHNRIYQK